MKEGLPGVHGPRQFKSGGEWVGTHDDVNGLYGLSIAQYLAYAENMFDENTPFEAILLTPDYTEIGFIVE